MSRRTMDDAHYNVVAAFMLLFQGHFIPDVLLSEFDITRTTIKWDSFLTKLEAFYRSHFHEFNESMQSRSAFTYCRADDLTYRRSQFDNNTRVDRNNTPKLSLRQFSPNTIAYNENVLNLPAPQIIDESDRGAYNSDRSLYASLKFFVPALIWAYNELKDTLIVDEAVISQCRTLLAANQRVLTTKETEVWVDLEASLPNRECLMVGTGVEVRANRRWKSKLTKLKKDDVDARARAAAGTAGEISSQRASSRGRASRGSTRAPSPSAPTAPAAMRMSRQPSKQQSQTAETAETTETTDLSTRIGVKRKDAPPKRKCCYPFDWFV